MKCSITLTRLPRTRFAFLALFIIGACAPTPEVIASPVSASPAASVIKGYGISPLGFPNDYSRFPDFLAEVGSLPNGGVMFNGAWRQDVTHGANAGQIPPTAIGLVQESATYSYAPIVVFGWRTEQQLHLSVPANATNDWTNAEAKVLFKQMLVDFASYHPPYVFLGNESDAYFIANPVDYARWVAFYNEAYDAIKAVSPETQIGPVFQYERMSGQGYINGWTTPYWGALEAHDLNKVDIIGITMYPWLSVASPEQIPDGYLDPLIERIGDKPIAITETGWPGDPLGLQTAWEASPEAQLRFVAALDRILDGANLHILNWLHLYQMDVDPASAGFAEFMSISLRDAEGNKRPIYDEWVEFQP